MQRRVLLKSTAATLLAVRGSGASRMVAPAIAQPTNIATLRFVAQAKLTLLDPVFTTATVTSNHGYYRIRHVLFGWAGRRLPPADGRGPHGLGRQAHLALRLGVGAASCRSLGDVAEFLLRGQPSMASTSSPDPRFHLQLRGGSRLGDQSHTGSGRGPPSATQRQSRPKLVCRRDVHPPDRSAGSTSAEPR